MVETPSCLTCGIPLTFEECSYCCQPRARLILPRLEGLARQKRSSRRRAALIASPVAIVFLACVGILIGGSSRAERKLAMLQDIPMATEEADPPILRSQEPLAPKTSIAMDQVESVAANRAITPGSK